MNGKKGFRKVCLGEILEPYDLEKINDGDKRLQQLHSIKLESKYVFRMSAKDADCQITRIQYDNPFEDALFNSTCYLLHTSGIVCTGQYDRRFYFFDSKDGNAIIEETFPLFWKLKTDSVLIEYLLMELRKDYVNEQLEPIWGDFIPVFSYDFKDNFIYVPEGDKEFSLYEQQRIFNEYRQQEAERVMQRMGVALHLEATLPPHTLLDGGRYTIEAHIDGGGFGKMYRATLKLPTHRQHVALKELFVKEYCTRRPLTNEVQTRQTEDFRRQQQKFRKEHDILTKLAERTPYVPRVMSPVFAENHTLYYAMQYVENGTIWTHCRNNTLNQQELLTAICQAGIALHHAHDMDYLHFDVTPLNIMVDDNKHGILIDFGNSKHYSVDDDCITSVGQAAKTKSFASPELLHQTVSDYGMQADVYGLAVTLYAVLTGNVPYPRYTEEDTDYAKTIERNLRAQQVHPCVARTILRGISYKPKDRQSSVREFLQELLPALSGTDIAQEITELRPIKGFHPQNHKFSTAHMANFDQLSNMESE